MEPDSSSESTPVKSSVTRDIGDLPVSSSSLGTVEVGERAIQIVNVDPETREFYLDVDALSGILLRDECRDKPVCCISIAGDYRKGKSFLLNFLLRYLNANGANDWMCETNTPLKGFSWRGGSERDTTGILMWSEPFVIRLPLGKEVAVLLMDTQGAFDSEYTVRDSATVFALSTMTSSIQVFNLLHNLQEDNLQVLEIFTEYGRLALEETDEKPFQKLLFLIRDWAFAYEHDYGMAGGNKLLEKKLEIKDKQPTQLQRVRKHIRSCFSEIDCFLMPHPGKKVATNKEFDGRIKDIDEDFVQQLQVFVPLLLDPRHIVIKKIGGQQVTGRQLLEYFKVYINIFRGESMPEPKSMLEATAEANNLAAVALAKDYYAGKMEDTCGGNTPFMNPNALEQKHNQFYCDTIEVFNKARKMGGKEFSESYLDQLTQELAQAWEHYQAQNKSKNMFSLLGGPVILLCWCVVCFIISRIFDIIALTPLATLFWLFGTMSLAVTIIYMFCRYGGTMPEFVLAMDKVSEVIWGFALDVSFKMMQNAVQNRTGLNNTTSTFGSNSTVTTPTNQFNTRSPPFPRPQNLSTQRSRSDK